MEVFRALVLNSRHTAGLVLKELVCSRSLAGYSPWCHKKLDTTEHTCACVHTDTDTHTHTKGIASGPSEFSSGSDTSELYELGQLCELLCASVSLSVKWASRAVKGIQGVVVYEALEPVNDADCML